jgi:hypothetical protein
MLWMSKFTPTGEDYGVIWLNGRTDRLFKKNELFSLVSASIKQAERPLFLADDNNR